MDDKRARSMRLSPSRGMLDCCGYAVLILSAAAMPAAAGQRSAFTELAFLESPQPPLGAPGSPDDSQTTAAPSPGAQPNNKPAAKQPVDAAAEPDRCLTIAEIADLDRDFERNQALLSSPDLCMRKVQFSEGALRWKLQIIQNRKNPNGYFWFVPHDDENVAFDTAAYGVTNYGGTVVAIDTGGNRYNGPQDPNRNFDAGDAAARKCKDQVARSPIYTKRIVEYLQDRSIIALHSNKPEGQISIRTRMGSNTNYPARAPLPTQLPDHTVVFVASTAPPQADPELLSFVTKLNKAGLNVIYETVSPNNNDCSMSNFAALTKIRNYVNLEVVMGDRAGQKLMLDTVMPFLKEGIGPLTPSPAAQPPAPVLTAPPPAAAVTSEAPQPQVSPRPHSIRKGLKPPDASQNTAAASSSEPQGGTPARPPLASDNQAGAEASAPDSAKPGAPEKTASANIAPDAQPRPASPVQSSPSAKLAATPTAGAPRFTIQLGFGATEDEAKRTKQKKLQKLALRDEEIVIRPSINSPQPTYLIQYGAFATRSEGVARCREMNLSDGECWVVNAPK
jgi:hypothetical protein